MWHHDYNTSSTYLDFLCKGDDVIFVQIYYAVDVDFALVRAAAQWLAIAGKILRVKHRFLPEAYQQALLDLRFRDEASERRGIAFLYERDKSGWVLPELGLGHEFA